MAVKDWSTSAASNTTLGSLGVTDNAQANTIDDLIRELMAQIATQFGKINYKGDAIASASTVDLSTATGNFVHITGTTTITSFGTVAAGQVFILVFDGALQVTHNGTSLILPNAQNITTAAGDILFIASEGSGNWRAVRFFPATTEGVWTPTLITDGTQMTSVTYDAVTAGRYVKTGKLVCVSGRLRTDAITKGSASGNVMIGGFPFTAASAPAGSLVAAAVANWNAQNPFALSLNPGSTAAYLHYRGTVTGGTSLVQLGGVNTGADQNDIEFGGCYIAA